jgi:pimeloyl-ACP methyl ester carboxylesterase
MKKFEYLGSKIAYYTLNEKLKASYTLVFLHDALGSAAQLKTFPQRLCNALQCNGLIIERLGHGKSDPFIEKRNKQYMHTEALHVLPFVLNALNISNKITLVGNSDGGSIALIYAASFPEKVQALVAIAPHIFVEKITIEGINSTVKAFSKNSKLMLGLQKYHSEKAVSLFEAWFKTWLSPEFSNWNIEEYITTIQCPMLLIQGKNDEYGTLKQINSIHALAKQYCEIKVLEAGHFPHNEKEEECIVSISKFIQHN